MNRLGHALLAALTITTAIVPAHAQEAVPSAADAAADEAGSLGDIVVTAQKRAERILDVPIAIRAVQGEALVRAGVTDVNGLQNVAPDLNVVTNTIFTTFTIRGVSSQDIFETSDSAVTVNIDGEYLNRPVALNAALFDLDRIEVLRGPQGTLYGRNSTAGAVNIFANKPKLGRFEGSASASYGNYDAIQAQAAVNIPVGDTLAIRVAGQHAEHSGYRDNRPAGRGDDQNVEGARIGLQWEPDSRVSVYLAGEYVNVDQLPPSSYGIQVGLIGLPAGEAPSDIRFDFPRRGWPLEKLGNLDADQYAVRGEIDIDLDFATLSYVGGFRRIDMQSEVPLNGYVPAEFSFQNDKLDSDTQSHELRLTGDPAGAWFWQVGAFYMRETQSTRRGLYLDGPGAFIDYNYRDVISDSKSLFGQAVVPIVDGLSATIGGRYTWDRKKGTLNSITGFLPQRPLPTDPAAQITPFDEDWSKFTWNLGLDWKPRKDTLVYAKASSGYKAGGRDNSGPYDPEDLTAYEIGTKNRFDHGTLEVNASAFWYDYRDQQIQVFINTAIGNATRNAGKSTIKGIEVDFIKALSEADQVRFTVNYLDARFDRFLTVENVLGAPTRPVDLSGNRPTQAPRWTIVAGYDHRLELASGANISASAQTRFKSDYFLTAYNWEADRQKAYTQTDLSLSYNHVDDRFSVGAYVRNLEDTIPLTYSSFNGGGIDLYNFIFGQPRTYGVQASMRF
ncbi:iron complex outermembrane receptor protein [Sphingomonas zeicaulis]|uniref:TonB-dependent receptor n=1 Tax=Sphingomonas zeicaulis TaxID=1632740 RepID=UPI003D23ED74